MMDDDFGCGFRKLAVAEDSPASLGKPRPAGATAQQTDVVVALDLTHGEMGLARATTALAFRIKLARGSRSGCFLRFSLPQLVAVAKTAYAPKLLVNLSAMIPGH
jgi:hypothetical protein